MREWYEDRPIILRVLIRECAASDCTWTFEPIRDSHLYCSAACRLAEWRKENPERERNAS